MVEKDVRPRSGRLHGKRRAGLPHVVHGREPLCEVDNALPTTGQVPRHSRNHQGGQPLPNEQSSNTGGVIEVLPQRQPPEGHLVGIEFGLRPDRRPSVHRRCHDPSHCPAYCRLKSPQLPVLFLIQPRFTRTDLAGRANSPAWTTCEQPTVHVERRSTLAQSGQAQSLNAVASSSGQRRRNAVCQFDIVERVVQDHLVHVTGWPARS
ncbi:hypothetical protein UO65_2995 [Actinokineospora spheciospongiae]|uniref:Uncharacterized protein n=1 Tax=Actinokineospora spheciospongiae TaxID=909613 RepID=W7IXQ7_9PSEU|nr:hypothetical protein UO65_2995 [Actinokineospora spheciospongiae]